MTLERQLIGTGRISKVYSDGIYAYKTFKKDYPESWIAYEVKIHQEIKKKTNLPVLNYDYLKDSKEIKMDVIHGITLADRMRKDKYKQGLEDLMELQKTIYRFHDLDLPDGYDVFEKDILSSDEDQELKDIALDALSQIERKYELCHLDFHFENILYDGHHYVIIDWVNAKLCHKALDVARSYLIFKQYVQRKANLYLQKMMKDCDIEKKAIDLSIPVMAIIRLKEIGNSPFRRVLIDMIKAYKEV